MQTLEQWHESKQDFSSFAKSGDEIDEEMYYYFLEILPPVKMTGYGFLVGEPYDHDNEGKPLFAAFYQSPDGKYFYAGHKTTEGFSKGNLERRI